MKKWVPLILVIPALVGGLGANMIARWVTGFDYAEIHPAMHLAAPGTREVPENYRSWDGDRAWFDRLDTDSDGRLAIVDDDGGSSSSKLNITMPEVQRANAGFRRCMMAVLKVSGRGSVKSFPLPSACAPAGMAGEEGVKTSLGAVLESTRWMRHREDILAGFDGNGDGALERTEYPGAPRTRAYILGADSSGRDLLTRLCFGARASLLVAILAALTSLLV